MFRSATFKLTMYYVAIVMAISLSFSITLYHVASGELERGLRHETQRIYNQFSGPQPGMTPPKYDSELDSGQRRLIARLLIFNSLVLAASALASYALAKRTLEPIEAAHEQQKRFTADVSHELRTPLTALKMETEVALLNAKNDKAALRETLASNLEEIAKLEALVNNLLRLSRLEVDALVQNFKPLSTEVLANTALQTVHAAAAKRNITIKTDFKDAQLVGDKDTLNQLLVILLDNAIKYSPAKAGIEFSIASAGQHANFTITDHGIGIEKEALEHVFDRFYRADSARTKTGDSQGFGLGLSIAKMIADIHGGDIVLSSQPGHGTTATVSLPLQPRA